MPTSPTSTPNSRRGPVCVPNASHAISTVISGIPLLSIPATDESIHCCAIGNMVSGNAIHVTPSSAILGIAARGTGWRAAGMKSNVRAPNPTRSKVTSPGSKDSSPIAMKRNEPPQISESDNSTDHSVGAIGRSSAAGSISGAVTSATLPALGRDPLGVFGRERFAPER